MFLRWSSLWRCLVLFLVCSSSALCPSTCTCQQTPGGRKRASCVRGGMSGPVPSVEMDAGLEVLEISAPDDNWNVLIITPAFQHFRALEEVRVQHSSLLQIGMHVFWGAPSIRLLDLSSNNISAVFDHNFRGLLNLVELNLNDNMITSLSTGVFKHLSELRVLTVQRNFLNELGPRMFLKLGKLHVLKLSGNEFEDFNPEAFKDIPELRVLECRGCTLRRINTQIYHLLPYLSHLDFGNNEMQFISSDEFSDLRRLRSLKLDGNLLPVVLEKTFVNQQQLRYLCLAHNRLAKITNTAFYNLTSLVELDIGHNKLDKIEVTAMGHVSDTLQRLVISGNHFSLSVIKSVLQTVYRVWDLELANMSLKYLPDNFLPDRIRRLNLSSNLLSNLTAERLPKQLLELDVSGNQLKGINERLMFKLEMLNVLNLSNNPWSCTTCHLAPIIVRLNRTAKFRNLTCAVPLSAHGQKLGNLRTILDCRPVASDSTESSLMTAVVVSVSLVMFVVAYGSCLVWRKFRYQQRATSVKDEEVDMPTAICSKGEISSFQFPLDLTQQQRISVSTIDGIKKVQTLLNATGI